MGLHTRLPQPNTEQQHGLFTALVHQAAAFKITKILTNNGTQFTHRFTSKTKKPTGKHLFDQQCIAQGIEHRLIRSRHPQTNGMVERFNGRISEIVKQTRFESAAELAATLSNYLSTYNHHIPQRALNHLSPIEALQGWRKRPPELFIKRVYKQAGLDSYASSDQSTTRLTGVSTPRPSKKAIKLSAAKLAMAKRVATVALAMCGVSTTLGTVSRSAWT